MKPNFVIENDKMEIVKECARQCGCECEQASDDVILFYLHTVLIGSPHVGIFQTISVHELCKYDMPELADNVFAIAKILWNCTKNILKDDPEALSALKGKYAVNT